MLNAIVKSGRDAIVAYIRAKDENRPYLMNQAFHDAATLNIVARTDAMSFPPRTTGREAIADVLVREFGRTYENVRTFCLSLPPQAEQAAYSCAWLVGMSAKDNGGVRVGCGRYDWLFRPQNPPLAQNLTITIEVMQVLPANHLVPVMDWLDQLPYPWCSKQAASARAPVLDGLRPIRNWLSDESS